MAAKRHANQHERIPEDQVLNYGDVALVVLACGEVALIDPEDADRVGQHLWRVQRNDSREYARNDQAGPLHRFILDPDGKDRRAIDHINGNGLDNRKVNLRFCTTKQNIRNSGKYRFRDGREPRSRFKGVTRITGRRGWRASITVNGHKKNLGHYPTQELAARAYDMAARQHFGEFARPNFEASQGGEEEKR